MRSLDNYQFLDELNLIKTLQFEDQSILKIYNNLQVRESKNGEFLVQYIRTTAGRIIFNQILDTIITI